MNYYSILGVDKTATPEEIKKSYRKLASQHHPDKGGNTAMFQQIQEAYAVLSDPPKRKQYDFSQNATFTQFTDQFNDSFNQNPFNQRTNPFGNFEDLFSAFTANMNRNTRAVFRTSIEISLIDSYQGAEKTLELATHEGTKIIQITVPIGVKNGENIRYDKVINDASLIIDYRIRPDFKFERNGNDLYCHARINVLDLIVGTSIEFTTINGKTLNILIKERTQPHSQIKLAGYGMPIRDTKMYGDQYLLLKPYIPDNISPDIVDAIVRTRDTNNKQEEK